MRSRLKTTLFDRQSGEAGFARKPHALEHHHDRAHACEGRLHQMRAEEPGEPEPADVDINGEQDTDDDKPADSQKDRAFRRIGPKSGIHFWGSSDAPHGKAHRSKRKTGATFRTMRVMTMP